MNSNKTITFKKIMTVELTFEDFFSRFYDVGQEEQAQKVWSKMEGLKTEWDEYGDYDCLEPEIDSIKESAEHEIVADEKEEETNEEMKARGKMDGDGFVLCDDCRKSGPECDCGEMSDCEECGGDDICGVCEECTDCGDCDC
ncbi:MAG: hypothetical protein EBY29_13830 [Planctomycetes bacterium]|nr:hypothetical protein [Planctomycetota bacterium]